MMVELGELTWMVNYVDSLFFDRLHILEPASFHQGLWKTKRIPALLPFLLLLLCLCVHHKIRYGFL
jgi:hypothetical protein